MQVCGDRRWLEAALEEGADVNKSNAAGHTFFYFLLINMSSQADLDLFLELLPRIDLEKHRTTVRQTGFIECSAYHQLSRCSPFYLDAVMHVMEEDMPLVMQQMRYLHSRPQFRAIHDKATEMGWMPGKLKGRNPLLKTLGPLPLRWSLFKLTQQVPVFLFVFCPEEIRVPRLHWYAAGNQE
jgi:hypothetical protein